MESKFEPGRSSPEIEALLQKEQDMLDTARRNTSALVARHLARSTHIRSRFQEAEHLHLKIEELLEQHVQPMFEGTRRFSDLVSSFEPLLKCPDLPEGTQRYFEGLLHGSAKTEYMRFQSFLADADRRCNTFARRISSIKQRFLDADSETYDVVKSANSLLLNQLSNLLTRQQTIIATSPPSPVRSLSPPRTISTLLSRSPSSTTTTPWSPPYTVETHRNHAEFESLVSEVEGNCAVLRRHFGLIERLTLSVNQSIGDFISGVEDFVRVPESLRCCFALPRLYSLICIERSRRKNFHERVQSVLSSDFMLKDTISDLEDDLDDDDDDDDSLTILKECKIRLFPLLRKAEESEQPYLRNPFITFASLYQEIDTASSFTNTNTNTNTTATGDIIEEYFVDDEFREEAGEEDEDEDDQEEGEVYDEDEEEETQSNDFSTLDFNSKRLINWNKNKMTNSQLFPLPLRRKRRRRRERERDDPSSLPLLSSSGFDLEDFKQIRTRLNLREAELRAATHSNILLRRKLESLESSENLQLAELRRQLEDEREENRRLRMRDRGGQ